MLELSAAQTLIARITDIGLASAVPPHKTNYIFLAN